ncbi:DUF5719 family protein [Actinotalea sp.]|uniref:DUF5719 family protein n=1 Tax=Actinotalea sp. TaxID=1872145 RepID=UPI002CC9085B|nr:DUF5719 family protein [Actinotalea sp.]HQY34857.1 DUF5719 family protein [Actinotalea sp.]HRA51737.1 DUF5719 family protein [Actinotalea sp.]
MSGPEHGVPPTRRRAWAVVGALTTATAVLALTAGVAAVGSLRPPTAPRDVPLLAVDVPAAVTELVCPGTVHLATEPEEGSDAAYDPAFDPTPVASRSALSLLSVSPDGTSGAAVTRLGALDGADGDPVVTLAPEGRAAGATVDGLSGGLVLRADAAGEVPAWVAGATGVRTTDGDLRGLVAASCGRAAAEVWLVGGSTALGSSGRLVLVNPGRTAATVSLELWGPSGPVELAGAPQYLVPAGEERVVLLEGIAAEQERVVVHVTAAGGRVGAYLQDSALRGLVPAGTDDVVAGAAPAPQQVVPGVAVTASSADGADVALLRLLAPGSQGGTAAITVLGPEGPVDLPGAAELELVAGEVLDVPLGGLPPGYYTLVVDADVAVVAGAMITRGEGVGLAPDLAAAAGDVPLDRAWAPATVLGVAGPLALPPGVSGEVVVTAVPSADLDGSAPATLELVGPDGVLGTTTLRVAPGSTSVHPLTALTGASDAAVGLVLRSTDPRLTWAVVLTESLPDGDVVALLAPVPPAEVRPSVAVRAR